MASARTFCDTWAVLSRALPAEARDPWCRIHIQRENRMHVPLTVRKLLVGFAVVLVICIAAYLRFHHSKPVLEVAYAGSRQAILWDSSAEIREPIGTLKYGDRLDVLNHFQQQVKVRTTAGLIGWVAQSDLLSVDLWQKMQDLEARATSSPVEARGATRVISNLHIVPGRESPRLRQIGSNPAHASSRAQRRGGLRRRAGRTKERGLVAGSRASGRSDDCRGLDSRPVRGSRHSCAAS